MSKTEKGKHARKEPLGDGGFVRDPGKTSNMNPAASGQPYQMKTPTPTGGYKPMTDHYQSSGKRKIPSKKAMIAAGAVVGVLLVVYLSVAVFFSSHFYPNTTIGTNDISLMSGTEVENLIDETVEDYTVSVEGDGLSFELTASDIGATIDSTEMVEKLLGYNNPWAWPIEVFRAHDETEHMALSAATTGLSEVVGEKIEAYNATATKSVNATIAYDSDEREFVVVDEVYGTTVSVDAVVDAVSAAVAAMERQVTITETELEVPDIVATDQVVLDACNAANKMVTTSVKLTLSGTSVTTLDADVIAPWVVLGEDYSVAIDDNAVSVWADDVAGSVNTYGSTRTYTRADGKTVSVSGGVYGWITDKESLTANAKEYVANGTVGTYEIPMTQTAGAFNGVGSADWGTRYIDVDLSEQHAYFYDGTTIIWESDIVSGIPDGEHNTPTGIYQVTAKQSPSTLIGTMEPDTGEPEYETEVQFWMPFVGNSVGFHDATWQPGFGGTLYLSIGSHGCVNLPYDAASTLYSLISVGDVVVVHE